MRDMAANGINGIPPNHEENGRLYHGYRKGIYMYPCDEAEKDRMDIFHKLFLVARNGELHRRPLVITAGNSEVRILDLGTGTGIWAIDMADKYPMAEVIGTDIVNIQPEQIPPNLRFLIPRDYDSPWFLGENSFDLVHVRNALGAVQHWPGLYQTIFRHLKPGIGILEHVEIDLAPRCDDGTLPRDCMLTKWYGWLADATRRACHPISYPSNIRELLEVQGFVEIEETIIRLPLNEWPAVSDHYQKVVGRWYNLGLTEGLEALSLGPLTRVYGWPVDHVRMLVKEVKDLVCRRQIHAYNNLHIWTARRP